MSVDDSPVRLGDKPPASLDDLAAAGWQCMDEMGFLRIVGPTWYRDEESGRIYAFLAEAKHENFQGVVQGGMLMTFADRVLAATGRMATGGLPHATIQMNIHFTGAVRIGDLVQARARVARKTRTLIFLTGEIFVADDIVATAHGIWKILERIPSKAGRAGDSAGAEA